MTQNRHANKKSRPLVDLAQSAGPAIVFSFIAALIYDLVKPHDVWPKVLVFGVLVAALLFLALTASSMGRKLSYLRKLKEFPEIRTASDIDAYADSLGNARTQDRLAALPAAVRRVQLAVVLFAATVIVFILVAPWLFSSSSGTGAGS
ncbi:hypothetical protein [Plantibacter sp. T3]|uniref:hypothetical protein n=1 Tax=Plantibacter sp. T3 TaxID=2653161 RepID=UPI0012F358D6|nr:hypothetical protein [Plantibacter sp. T3]VXC39376.1 membrane hypothetical protein [Plantibacter sp. T3]